MSPAWDTILIDFARVQGLKDEARAELLRQPVHRVTLNQRGNPSNLYRRIGRKSRSQANLLRYVTGSSGSANSQAALPKTTHRKNRKV